MHSKAILLFTFAFCAVGCNASKSDPASSKPSTTEQKAASSSSAAASQTASAAPLAKAAPSDMVFGKGMAGGDTDDDANMSPTPAAAEEGDNMSKPPPADAPDDQDTATPSNPPPVDAGKDVPRHNNAGDVGAGCAGTEWCKSGLFCSPDTKRCVKPQVIESSGGGV